MKVISAVTVADGATRTRRGILRTRYVHTLTLSCGHVEKREEHAGTAWIAPSRARCAVCGR